MEKIINSNIINNKPKTTKILENILKTSKKQDEINSLLIYCITWNLHGKMPSKEELSKIIPLDKEYEIIIISTQECVRSILLSFLITNKEEWILMLKDYLGKQYVNLANENLSAFHISLFVNKKIKNDFKNIITGKIKTGYLNIIANKGAVAIGVKYKKYDLLFINCHLSAGDENWEKRNADFERINNELTFEVYGYNKKNKDIIINNNFTVTDNFDIIIWCGDFNSRLYNITYDNAFSSIKNKDYNYLFKYDQFNNDILNMKININGFQEGIIDFPPTYKYLENHNFYDYSQKLPGWTDRIIFKSKKFNDLLLCKYDCIMNTNISDHKPVFAIFKLDFDNEKEDDSINNKNQVCSVF